MPATRDRVFDRIVVDHLVRGETRVSWGVLPSFFGAEPYSFQLQWGRTGDPLADDWEDVGAPALWAQPAAWTVPLAFLAMVVGSLADGAWGRRKGRSSRAGRRMSVAGPVMVMIHTPEGLDVPGQGRRQ